METNLLSRRDLIRFLTLAAAAGATATQAQAAATNAHNAALHAHQPQLRMGTEQIAILVYPEFTALDALGPHYFLAGMMGATVRFVAKTKDLVPCEGATNGGFCIRPHMTFAECPANLDLLLIPGGVTGTLAAIADDKTRRFVADRGSKAKLAGSVCTGSLLLGAAGLLKGRKATSHWQTLDVLKDVGATPVRERIVFDGTDRVTAAGVSAGLDLGVELIRRFRGDFYAQGMQLLGEYDPQPPFPKGGNPATADKLVVDMLNMMHGPLTEQFRQTLAAAR
jgi:cyclohexyl-isocyanide hydratase